MVRPLRERPAVCGFALILSPDSAVVKTASSAPAWSTANWSLPIELDAQETPCRAAPRHHRQSVTSKPTRRGRSPEFLRPASSDHLAAQIVTLVP